jgi:hypothetical protein
VRTYAQAQQGGGKRISQNDFTGALGGGMARQSVLQQTGSVQQGRFGLLCMGSSFGSIVGARRVPAQQPWLPHPACRLARPAAAEKAWEAIISAPEVARGYSQQIVETEHLFKALLEQPAGLARRILSKAGANPTHVLDRVDAFIRRQPRVSGQYEQILGRSLEALVNRAEELKAKWGDQYVSVEELVAALADDARFGESLFREVGLPRERLEEIIQEIRGGKT